MTEEKTEHPAGKRPAFAFSSDEKEAFSLHDCRAKSASFEDGRLTFFFPDGIFWTGYGRDWPNTGPAAAAFDVSSPDDVRFYLFTERDGETVRERVPAEELIGGIIAGAWELEFLYRYDGYRDLLYLCEVWQSCEPYSRQAQLFIGTDRAVFFWNPPADGQGG